MRSRFSTHCAFSEIMLRSFYSLHFQKALILICGLALPVQMSIVLIKVFTLEIPLLTRFHSIRSYTGNSTFSVTITRNLILEREKRKGGKWSSLAPPPSSGHLTGRQENCKSCSFAGCGSIGFLN